MTRLRVYVNPESRDILLVHAQEKKHADFAFDALGCRDLSDRDPYVLGEINVSFVLPLPQQAPPEIARLAIGPVAIGKEGSPVTADTDRKSGCLDTYLT
jgi:hypothetical protein